MSDNMYVRINLKNVSIAAIVLVFGYIGILIWSADQKFPDINVNLREICSYAILAAITGGKAVMFVNEERKLEIVKKGKTVEGADDLLTKADLASNYMILNVLQRFPGLNVITEEKRSELSQAEIEKYQTDNYRLGLSIKAILQSLPSRKVNLSSLTVWVDPLDATQEFTEGLLEYVTVMVCVAEDGRPIFGVIHRPFSNETWFGLDGFGVTGANGEKWGPGITGEAPNKILISRSHSGTVKKAASQAFGKNYTVEPAGGAGYKILRLINATAALYLHSTFIKKWDLCAGDALLRSVGGALIDLDGSALDYSEFASVVNKKGILAAARNPYTYYQQWRNSSS